MANLHKVMEISHVLMLISHVCCLHMLMRFHDKLEWGNYPQVQHTQPVGVPVIHMPFRESLWLISDFASGHWECWWLSSEECLFFMSVLYTGGQPMSYTTRSTGNAFRNDHYIIKPWIKADFVREHDINWTSHVFVSATNWQRCFDGGLRVVSSCNPAKHECYTL